MAKVFRFIVNFCIIVFLLTGAALVVPQFAGVTTVIVDENVTETNLTVGSVVYGKSVTLSEVQAGDKMLRTSGESVYVTKVRAVDTQSGLCTVVAKDGTLEEVTVRRTMQKVLITVPYIGYASVAMHSFEGRIILGLILALLVILFILSEIWRNGQEDDDEDEDEDEDETADQEFREENEMETSAVSSAAATAQDEKETVQDLPDTVTEEEDSVGSSAKADQEVEELILEFTSQLENDEPAEKEDTEETAEAETEDTEEAAEAETEDLEETTEAETEELEEIPEPDETTEEPAVDEMQEMKEDEDPSKEAALSGEMEEDDFTAALRAALENAVEPEETADENVEEQPKEQPDTAQLQQEPEEEEKRPRRLAIPVLTVEELLEKAAINGDEPKIVEEKEDGITFLDYSEIL